VNAIGVHGIFNAVQTPIVEYPGITRGHVYGLISAEEAYLRMGDNRNVQAHAVEPMVVDIRMRRHAGEWRELEQP
jgi:hypothetical protein